MMSVNDSTVLFMKKKKKTAAEPEVLKLLLA